MVCNNIDLIQNLSPLQQLRLTYQPQLPALLQHLKLVKISESLASPNTLDPRVTTLFPQLSLRPRTIAFSSTSGAARSSTKPHRVGVLFSGGQAAGGHNVIIGLFEALKQLHPESTLIGFCGGPQGLLNQEALELTADRLKNYRNQGGFDLLGSGRTKIQTREQFQAVETAVQAFSLDALVIIGGDDSNTNAALLAEYFLDKGSKTVVVGVPKTIDGDLKNEEIEISFGYHSAVKTYAEIIGNLARDTLSAKKVYNFIRLMGRTASHITLECALRTQPNLALISEELAAGHKTLSQLVDDMCTMICKRSEAGKEYGVVLIPEGIVEFLSDVKQLIAELNALLAPDQPHVQALTSQTFSDQIAYVAQRLTREASACWKLLPAEFQQQLLLDRDSHGNVQVSKIETERLLVEMVKRQLTQRKKSGTYSGKFVGQSYFCGYEGRSCFPTNFDAQYCYALGNVAALLIEHNVTGYICYVQNLAGAVSAWRPGARNLATMMTLERREGKEKPVIAKALVDLEGSLFRAFQKERGRWMLEDNYRYPGPIQFFGPVELTDEAPYILSFAKKN